MKKILSLLFFVSSLFSIYVEKFEDLEKHKELAWQQDFDSVGFIRNKFGMYATGTLIHPNIVITTAHLFYHEKKAIFNMKINGKHVKVKGQSICHPKYTYPDKKNLTAKQSFHDIALFILEKPINLPFYPTIAKKLPCLKDSFYAVGFGKWKRTNPLSTINKKIAGKIFLFETNKKYTLAESENSRNIDLFVTPKKGDSGSPLLSLYKNPSIFGVLSGNFNPKEVNKSYKLYINPYFHIDWINKTIKENTV